MRLFEFITLYEYVEPVAGRLPSKYEIDDATGLGVNLPNQWSQSPYLGAVKNNKGNGYVAQIHIPQNVWRLSIEGAKNRWPNAPETLFQPEARQRIPIRIPFKDPRQAAWFVQQVLYGDNMTPDEVILDYLDEKYGNGDGSIWRTVYSKVPTYDGNELTSDDEQRFFSNKQEYQKQQTVKKNTSNYEAQMPAKIKEQLMAFFSNNRKQVKKKFGKDLTLNQLSAKLDQLINERGIDYFVTSPGSLKIKNVNDLTF